MKIISDCLQFSLQFIIGAVAVVGVGVIGVVIYRLLRSAQPGRPAPAALKGPMALDKDKKIPFKLIAKHEISHDTRRFRFALQTDKHVLGLPIGEWVGG